MEQLIYLNNEPCRPLPIGEHIKEGDHYQDPHGPPGEASYAKYMIGRNTNAMGWYRPTTTKLINGVLCRRLEPEEIVVREDRLVGPYIYQVQLADGFIGRRAASTYSPWYRPVKPQTTTINGKEYQPLLEGTIQEGDYGNDPSYKENHFFHPFLSLGCLVEERPRYNWYRPVPQTLQQKYDTAIADLKAANEVIAKIQQLLTKAKTK